MRKRREMLGEGEETAKGENKRTVERRGINPTPSFLLAQNECAARRSRHVRKIQEVFLWEFGIFLQFIASLARILGLCFYGFLISHPISYELELGFQLLNSFLPFFWSIPLLRIQDGKSRDWAFSSSFFSNARGFLFRAVGHLFTHTIIFVGERSKQRGRQDAMRLL
jgi:hypothetical protein